MEKKIPKTTMTVCVSEPLKFAVERVAAKEGISLSVAVAKLLLRALGKDESEALENTRKQRNYVESTGAIQLKQMDMPWPKDILAIMDYPYRNWHHYNILLDQKRWGIHSPGRDDATCPSDCSGPDSKYHEEITPQEKDAIKKYRDKFGIN